MCGYNLFFSAIKRNQNGIFVFVKRAFNVDLFEYNFIETKFLKLFLINLCTLINILIYIYRSPSTDISIFFLNLE